MIRANLRILQLYEEHQLVLCTSFLVLGTLLFVHFKVDTLIFVESFGQGMVQRTKY
jgi:hypothetical protein